jgi:D-alanine transaminase
MTRTVWLNGDFLPEDQAMLPIFDRGLLFADAIYEGLGVLDGQIVDFPHHMARLRRSLAAVRMTEPMDEAAFGIVLRELVRRNGVDEGILYLHLTRGAHDRDYLYPDGLTPNVFAFTQPTHGQKADDPPRPIAMASTPDLRWRRRDIKTTNLLGQVLAKVAARDAGADEALMIAPDGTVTEGGAVSFFVVRDGTIWVRPLSTDILGGMTRRRTLEVAAALGIPTLERTWTLDETMAADEGFVTGASSYVEPIGRIDGQIIGNGGAGPVTKRLRQAYLAAIRADFLAVQEEPHGL